jgi:6-phosphofructokinase 1
MRSGSPDSLDRMVARNFGNMALDLVRQDMWGHMVCLKAGRYDKVPLAMTGMGVKRVDVENFYDLENYCPRVAHVLGMPMFLY